MNRIWNPQHASTARKTLPAMLLASTVLAGAVGAHAAAATDTAQATSSGTTIGEVIVTASKRSENIQKVPMSIQAIDTKKLTQLNISSFNVTDVGYHYIGLRVMAAMPDASRDEQTATIARSVLKYARDKALRLMLPEPKGTYETVGEKVSQELAHFDYAEATKGHGYSLTSVGKEILGLLNQKKHVELRRRMALIHRGRISRTRIRLPSLWRRPGRIALRCRSGTYTC